jgi:plasmid stabilization system protein ParE
MKTRKFVALLLALSLLFISGSAFAQGGQMTQRVEATTQNQLQNRVQIREEVMEIRQNNEAIQVTAQELRQVLEQIRQKLQAMQEDGTIGEEEMAQIRQQLRLIQQHRKVLGATIGRVRTEAMQMRQFRANNDYTSVMTGLNRVQQIQQIRLQAMTAMLADAEELLLSLDAE